MSLLAGEAPASRRYDVIVVGAGPAGLALARSLASRRRRVLVLEAGGASQTPAARSCLEGTVAAASFHPATDLYRVRALGGASRIWGGRCIPFDDIDFERRDWVAGSGWPIGPEALRRHQAEALALAEAGIDEFDPHAVLGAGAAMIDGLDGGDVVTTLERFSRPTDAWRHLRDEVSGSDLIDVAPDHPVVAIRIEPDGRVRHLEVRRGESSLALSAPLYVVAGGGLETVRLLMASDDVRPGGIGGDCLGRHYMSHLCTTGSVLTLADGHPPPRFGYERDAEGVYLRRRLWVSPQAQRRERLFNTTFRTHLPDPGDPSHGSAVLSSMFLAKALVQREYAAKFSEGRVGATAHMRHLRNIAAHPFELAGFAAMWTRRRILASRKLPSVVLPASAVGRVVEFHAEQEPNRDSRVVLSGACDALGMRRLHVDWRPSAADIDSVVRSHRLLDAALRRSATGSLAFDEAELADRSRRFGFVGGHHIGLARMAADERHGVVDADLRVFGTANLHLCSAAVLPTSGQANPTLTLLCLAFRLAGHLDARLAAGDVPESRTLAA